MEQCAIGVYGLGVMGKSLAMNFIRHGFPTSLYSKSEPERNSFSCPEQENWTLCQDEATFVASLKRPRIVFLMITAGKPVDSVLDALLPLLEEGDTVIDGGNSYFEDTKRRCARTERSGVAFLGLGVSGGEKGALEGPCMMAGGSIAGWKASSTLLQAIAAKAPDGAPCCAYVGPEGAGHYVKMVHNGIEYAIMQQLADLYGLMRDGMGMSAGTIADVFRSWQKGVLNSYLVDITIRVLEKQDADGGPLIDRILDVARQKGTGCWSVLEAARRGVYVPCIDEALFTRYHSEQRAMRTRGAAVLPHTPVACPVPTVLQLQNALYLAIICSYSQGIALIGKASEEFHWDIDLALAVSLWRNGCIIRSDLLGVITASLRHGERQLLFTEGLGDLRVMEAGLRAVSIYAVATGTAAPALSAAMLYYDQCCSARMNVNLVQGLRDCFGAHTYERLDRAGSFHTAWED